MTLVICLSLRDRATEAAAAVVDAAPTHPPQSCGMHGDIPALSIWLEIVKRDLPHQVQCFSAHGMCLCVALKTPVASVHVTRCTVTNPALEQSPEPVKRIATGYDSQSALAITTSAHVNKECSEILN